MSDIRNIMNPSLGVQGVLDPAIQDTHLPQARTLATDLSPESGLAELYRMNNLQSRILSGLQPRVGDEALLRPDMLRKNLQQSFDGLKDNRDPYIRRFVRDDLKPLLENEQLLTEYVNMLVSG
ncbi:hypothetical protein FACS1894116_03300 [Betaproteobacteria bacterium]|nr:hypothetical protein AGMMS49543_06040 [Betaproteobacteria bacterium]GHT92692.1 hypothetical protein FACS1894116_03300 [Betaproteobacteria bacterium]GHU00173.1 hypothetical protein AGMMS49960_07600 [Betaproteobacteria bacterium]GHU07904.1 hypothetical protein AGMMS50225_05600 [Betaproteobacteria bacterium]GHU21596.1 hypothetical protein AGMMS50243_19610 [Betaproteobacteria bacterium]